MKHLKIILTLTVVVLVSSLAVFFADEFTSPIIEAYNIKIANEAKYEVLPDLSEHDDLTPTTEYDFTGTSITELIIVDDVGYIYTAEFSGFVGKVIYMVAFDLDGNITGYKTLVQNETAGLGAVISEKDFQDQFIGMAQDEIDGIGGSTAMVTLGGLITSLEKVALFHSVEFQGVIVETPEQRLNRLKEEISEVGAVFTDDTSDYDLSGFPITKVETTDNDVVIYTVAFDGYNPGIIYLVAFDLDTNDIIGFRVIEQYETLGLGAVIEDEEFQAQFDDLAQGDIDSIAGTTAAVTLGYLKDSLEEVVIFHKAEFEGEVPETEAQKILRFKQEITVVDALLDDVSGDYDLTNSLITKVEMANDGTDDVAVIYTVEFEGYNTSDVVEYIISFDLVTNDILGFRVLYQNETPGYGDAIENDDYYLQFVGMAQIDALNGDIDDVAGTSGAPITMGAFKLSLNEVVVFHKAEFEGVIVESDQERLDRLWLELFPTAVTFTKVTRDYAAHYDIEEFYEVYDGSSNYLGNLYHIKAEGANYDGIDTIVEFFLGIAPDRTFTGLRMWDDTETPGKATEFYFEIYGDSYTGDDIEDTFTIDDVGGSTITNNALQDAALSIAIYHVEEYLGQEFARPANVNLDDEDLLLAYPTANSFNSVYQDYTYESHIYNIYEALDGGGSVIGYVYYANAPGNDGTINFAWGVDLSGLTQQLAILNDVESWDDAQTYDDYDGSAGYWPDTPWIDNFEGVTFSSLLATEVDLVAGVSTTTGGMRAILEGIAQYHSDESVGGAG